MFDVSALRLLLLALTGWLERRERDAIAYLIEENRLLRRQLGDRRLRLTDADRRQLAALAHRLGRRLLRDVATVATPDTLLRWHRQLIARKWTAARRHTSRQGFVQDANGPSSLGSKAVYRLGLSHDDLLLLIDQHVVDRLSLRIHTALGDGSRLAILRDLPFLYREFLAFQESDALCDVAVNASECDCLAGNRARPGLGPGILLAIVLSSVFDG